MLTEAEIRKMLRENPDWEPVNDEDWDLYEKVKESMTEEGDMPMDDADGDWEDMDDEDGDGMDDDDASFDDDM